MFLRFCTLLVDLYWRYVDGKAACETFHNRDSGVRAWRQWYILFGSDKCSEVERPTGRLEVLGAVWPVSIGTNSKAGVPRQWADRAGLPDDGRDHTTQGPAGLHHLQWTGDFGRGGTTPLWWGRGRHHYTAARCRCEYHSMLSVGPLSVLREQELRSVVVIPACHQVSLQIVLSSYVVLRNLYNISPWIYTKLQFFFFKSLSPSNDLLCTEKSEWVSCLQ